MWDTRKQKEKLQGFVFVVIVASFLYQTSGLQDAELVYGSSQIPEGIGV